MKSQDKSHGFEEKIDEIAELIQKAKAMEEPSSMRMNKKDMQKRAHTINKKVDKEHRSPMVLPDK